MPGMRAKSARLPGYRVWCHAAEGTRSTWALKRYLTVYGLDHAGQRFASCSIAASSRVPNTGAIDVLKLAVR